MEQVILINEQDEVTGYMEKMEAHRKGLLHRAFSVLIFNAAGEMLLQKRADGKYHSGGLWTNTCCGHPRPDETLEEAAQRRLREEMGLSATLKLLYPFQYHAVLNDGLVENELDWVMIGRSDEAPTPNPAEAGDWKYITLDEVTRETLQHPERFTVWFNLIVKQLGERQFSTHSM